MVSTEPAGEGLRQRKKRLTRQQISDVATGLFLERGFADVTVAEVAQVAEVSVNTVYNYFPAKEDLVYDREVEAVERLARIVAERKPGESAAQAVLRRLRAELRRKDPALGLAPGFERFVRLLNETPALEARGHRLRQHAEDALASALATEAGARAGDPVPELVAAQLGWLNHLVTDGVSRRIGTGEDREAIVKDLLKRLDAAEKLLGTQVLEYAVREA
jgi:AcrR family transcriptional regulator